MTWQELNSDDKIIDTYKDDGTKEVKIITGGDEYASTNATVVEGAEVAKLAKAIGGSDVTVKADLSGTAINGISYEIAG